MKSLSSRELLKIINEAACDKKAFNIKTLDVSDVTVMTDYFFICSSDSTVQSRAIADNIIERLEEAGLIIKPGEGYKTGDWVVLDTRKVIVHIFLPEIREYYNLEHFWEEELGKIRVGASDNLSSHIKTRKMPARLSSKGSKKASEKSKKEKSSSAGSSMRKSAASTAKALKTAEKVSSKSPVRLTKEKIEQELLTKSKVKKSAVALKSGSEKSRKEIIEEEIIKMKKMKEDNQKKQKTSVAKKKTAPAPAKTTVKIKKAVKK